MFAKVIMLILKSKICGIVKHLRTITRIKYKNKPGFGWEVRSILYFHLASQQDHEYHFVLDVDETLGN